MNYRFTILCDYGHTLETIGAGILFINGETTCNTIYTPRSVLRHENVTALFRQLASIVDYGIIALELDPIHLPAP